MDWREAFEANKHAVGRAVHEAWAAEKIKQGFADHDLDAIPVYNEHFTDAVDRLMCARCPLGPAKHHTDMLDYDDLAPHIQEYDIQTGIVGFRMGFEAATGSADRAGREGEAK